MPAGYNTWQDNTTRPEDVVALITNSSFKSTPFVSMIGESQANNTYHEWLRDAYAASADNATVEGSDAVVVDETAPVRPGNVVQLFRKTITVSDTEQAIPHYGTGNPFTYYTQKHMVEMAKDIEKAAIAGTTASGNSGVARRMNGAIAMISTNKTARASGTSLSEVELNDILAGVYDNGTDAEVSDIFVGSYLKRVISGMTQGSTKFLDVERNHLVRRVEVYESDFGTVAFHLSREVPTGALLAVDITKWKLAWLVNRRAKVVPLAKTGSATKAMIEGEATLEALAELSSAYRSGFFVG